MKAHRTRSQTAGELQRTCSQTAAHRKAHSQGASSKGKAPAKPAPAQSPALSKVKITGKKEGTVSIKRILKKYKETKGGGKKKHDNRLDIYKDSARWNTKTVTFDVSHIGVLYAGINKHFVLEGVDMVGLPEDRDKRHFNAFKERIGKEQLLKDLEDMLEHNLLKDMAEILNVSKKDSRAQDTCQLKAAALEFLQRFLSITLFDPPLSMHAPKNQRGTNHKQIARVMIPPEFVAEFNADPDAFLAKLENGQIKCRAHDLGLCLYKNGVYDKSDPEDGLFRSLFLVLIWKFIYMGPEAAAMHSVMFTPGEEPSTSRGQAAKHGLLEPTKDTIAYAVVHGIHAIGMSGYWRKGQNGMLNSQLHRAVLRYFDNPVFAQDTLYWWKTQVTVYTLSFLFLLIFSVSEGLAGASVNPTSKEDTDVDPDSMFGKTLQKREFRHLFLIAVKAAAAVGAAVTADTSMDQVESLETRLEQRHIALVSTVIIQVSTDDSALPPFTDDDALVSTSADNTEVAAPVTDDFAPPPSCTIGSLVNSSQVEDPTDLSGEQLMDWDSDNNLGDDNNFGLVADDNDFGLAADAMAIDKTQYVGGSTQTQRGARTSEADAIAESVTEPETEEDKPPPPVKQPLTSNVKKTYRRSAAMRIIEDSDTEDDKEVEEKLKSAKSKGKGKHKVANGPDAVEKKRKKQKNDTEPLPPLLKRVKSVKLILRREDS
ncbi:hypothetical protein PM082_012581 [Marasmius tenuissimus]|nr:hypothetical protein PM082_012581 [Marasmius tenuissimus]